MQKSISRKSADLCIFLKIKTIDMSVQEKIIKAFEQAGKPLKAGEVAEIAGLDKKEVDKEIKKLTVVGTLYSPQRCFYDIKK